MKKIYLDYAATTSVDPDALKAMQPYFITNFGNTMSLHSFGQDAKIALENSRSVISSAINAKPNEIIFTSSATESNNFALKGIAFANKGKGRHIIISSIEHPCVIESARWLKSQGFEVEKIKVDRYGLVDSKSIEKAIRKDTILVSIIYASNEIGTIEPIGEIGKICKKKGVYFHTDAVQAFGKIPINVLKENIDLLTASSHKIYGPKGAAFLYVRNGIRIVPLLHGGGQENGLRGSTINVPAIVGFAKATEIALKTMKSEAKRISALKDKLIKGLLKIEGVRLNGHLKMRLFNNVNVRFPYIEGESLVMLLDMKGIACSTGSACSSATLEPSHVLLATGLRPDEAHGSLRITLGRHTKEKDINYLLKVLPEIVKQLRQISPYGKK